MLADSITSAAAAAAPNRARVFSTLQIAHHHHSICCIIELSSRLRSSLSLLCACVCDIIANANIAQQNIAHILSVRHITHSVDIVEGRTNELMGLGGVCI